jgi:hypothetical protein
MLKNAMEESNHLTCMGDLSKNFLNLPSNINDLKIKLGLRIGPIQRMGAN